MFKIAVAMQQAMLLVVLTLAGLLPTGALADYVVNSDEVRQALAEAVTEEEYPLGMFDFLTARMEISEDVTFGEFVNILQSSRDHFPSTQRVSSRIQMFKSAGKDIDRYDINSIPVKLFDNFFVYMI